MPYYDMPIAQLHAYEGSVEAPSDFDAFWARTLAANSFHPLDLRFEDFNYGLTLFEVLDVTFSGFEGQPVKAWMIYPKNATGSLPCIVKFVGYGGGRGQPHDHLFWPGAGYALFVMDTRGQGSTWSQGSTPDDGSGPAHPGFMTRGIMSRDTYYYRRVISDAARAIEAARMHPMVDPKSIAVCGMSQGGGLAIAAAALDPGVRALIADVPFLCDFPRAISLANRDPYTEIVRYLAVHRNGSGEVAATLQYFDGVCFARRITASALFSVALMDTICPPSTVYAAYNSLQSIDKEIVEYPYNDHEGGGSHHDLVQLAWLRTRLKGDLS